MAKGFSFDYNPYMVKGLLIVLSGPSGVGKGTLRMEIMKKRDLNLWFSVSMTTRQMREGEMDGREYFFVSKEEFFNAMENDELLEFNNYVDNFYGTPKKVIEEKRNQGFNVLLEIDTNGARQVMKQIPAEDILSIFVLPPTLEELAHRLENRASEPEEIIAKRVELAKFEIEYSRRNYRYHVINDDVCRCADEIASIIRLEYAKLEK